MNELEGIAKRLDLVTPAYAYVHDGASYLLGSIAVLSFCFASFRTLVFKDTKSQYEWVFRIILVTISLDFYEEIVKSFVVVADGMASYFTDLAGFSDYWATIDEKMDALFNTEEPFWWARLMGLAKSSFLTLIVTLSYFTAFLAFEIIKQLAAVFATLLYVIGPLMIVGSILNDGKSLKQWGQAFLQVLLWPSIPAFALMMVLLPAQNAIETENIAFILLQNCVLGILILFTPYVVQFMMGSGGIAAAGQGILALAGSFSASAGSALRESFSNNNASSSDAQASGGNSAPRPDDQERSNNHSSQISSHQSIDDSNKASQNSVGSYGSMSDRNKNDK